MKTKNRLGKSTLIILLCWLVYAISYIGKLSYSANINQIGEAFSVSYADTGMVATFFFFAYGIGQIVNGLLCKKYNIKLVIFLSLITSGIINVLIVTVPSFSVMKYLWLANGASMSFLWTSLIRLLSETLAKADMTRAIVAMGTTVATGTFIVYGLSAIFAALGNFRIVFYIAAALIIGVAFIWIFSYDKLVIPLRAERELDLEVNSADGRVTAHARLSASLKAMLITLAFFAVANNFVKDGLTSWTPDILKATYDTPSWLSILLTLLLPVMAIFGAVVAVNLQKRTRSFVGSCAVLFALSSILIGAVLGLLSTGLLPVTVGCFAIVSCLMAGVNNIVTSMVPLHLKENGANSGLLAGLLNGCCYLGSTISSYGLGAVADNFGWRAVFVLLLSVSGFVTLIGICYIFANNFSRR